MTERKVTVSTSVAAPPDEVYHYWNERTTYPRFVPRLESVTPLDEVWSRWTLAGSDETVDVEVTDNVLGHYVSWRCHRPTRDRTSVRIEGEHHGPTTVSLELSWQDDADGHTDWHEHASAMLDGFCAFLQDDHAGYMDALVADQQLPHTD